MRATARSISSSRRLRRQLSLPEMLLWRVMRQTRGVLRFRRRHAIGPFVAYFCCPAAKLVTEVAGQLFRLCSDAAGPSTTQLR